MVSIFEMASGLFCEVFTGRLFVCHPLLMKVFFKGDILDLCDQVCCEVFLTLDKFFYI